VIKYAGRRD